MLDSRIRQMVGLSFCKDRIDYQLLQIAIAGKDMDLTAKQEAFNEIFDYAVRFGKCMKALSEEGKKMTIGEMVESAYFDKRVAEAEKPADKLK